MATVNSNAEITKRGEKADESINSIFGDIALYNKGLKSGLLNSNINFPTSKTTNVLNHVNTSLGKKIFNNYFEKVIGKKVLGLSFQNTVAPKITNGIITPVEFFTLCQYTFKIPQFGSDGKPIILSNGTYKTIEGSYLANAIDVIADKINRKEINIPGDSNTSNGVNYSYVCNLFSAVFEEAIGNLVKHLRGKFVSFSDPFAVFTNKKITTAQQVAEKREKIKQVYPKTFFGYNAPLVPFVEVAFKSQYTPGFSDPDGWEAITFNPNSHLVSMDFEDNKGVKKLILKLFDKYYTDIENTIMRAIFIINNKSRLDTKIDAKGGDANFEFYLRADYTYSNLRVRFGYNTDIIPDGEKLSNFKDRARGNNASKPVVYTDWFYFLIMGFKQEPTEGGLNVEINAISSTGNFLSNIKMLQKFAVVKGLTQNIINSFSSTLNASFKATYGNDINKYPIRILPVAEIKNKDYANMEIVTDSESSQYPFYVQPIEVKLGDKPRKDASGNDIPGFKSIKEILDEICSKVPPIYIDNSNNIKLTVPEQNTDNLRLVYYTYSVSEREVQANDGTKITQNVIRFYYANPDDSFNSDDGLTIRTYYWRNYGATIIKNISISTSTDFAQMNMPLATISEKEGIKLITTRISPDASSEEESEVVLGEKNGVETVLLRDATVYYNSTLKQDIFSCVGRTYYANASGTSSPDQITNIIASQFAKNINGSIFKGTIELAGDPFYIFDDTIEPYKYLIKIVVIRPDDKKIVYDESAPGNNKKVSYISGYYTLTNIKHRIDDSGFSTILEVMRWPSAYEIPEAPVN
jgi:hypothetical protein